MDECGLLADVADAPRVAPLQPWALALYQERQRPVPAGRPDVSSTASRPAVRGSSSSRYGVQFVEDRDRRRIFVLIGSGNSNYRIVYLDGRSHVGQVAGDDDNPLYYGRSVGAMGGRHAGRRYARLQRGLLVQQRRASPYRASCGWSSGSRATDFDTLRYEVTVEDAGRVHATVVERLDAAVGRAGAAAASVPGQQTMMAPAAAATSVASACGRMGVGTPCRLSEEQRERGWGPAIIDVGLRPTPRLGRLRGPRRPAPLPRGRAVRAVTPGPRDHWRLRLLRRAQPRSSGSGGGAPRPLRRRLNR